MTSQSKHLAQLSELAKTYKPPQLAAILSVSVRSVQNYLNGEKPSGKTIERIDETFAKHKQGEDLTEAKKSPSEMDRLDVLIANNTKLAEAVLLLARKVSSDTTYQEGQWLTNQSEPTQDAGSQFGKTKRKGGGNQAETDT